MTSSSTGFRHRADNLSLLARPRHLIVPSADELAFDPILEAARVSAPAIILDLPHLWTAWVRRLLGAADEVVITTMPDLASLRNAKNLIDQLKMARPNDGAPRLVIVRWPAEATGDQAIHFEAFYQRAVGHHSLRRRPVRRRPTMAR